MAVDLDCASADHLTYLTDDDIDVLASSNTVAGLVPAADFSTRMPHYPNARGLIEAGATIALSPDCNPGSSYTTSMPFTIALAVREMHMTVDGPRQQDTDFDVIREDPQLAEQGWDGPRRQAWVQPEPSRRRGRRR